MHVQRAPPSQPSAACLAPRRALESFQALQQDKAHCLAHPDVLISAVGTKIYMMHEGGAWQEDSSWVALLDKGWEGQVVRDAAYSALAKVRAACQR